MMRYDLPLGRLAHSAAKTDAFARIMGVFEDGIWALPCVNRDCVAPYKFAKSAMPLPPTILLYAFIAITVGLALGELHPRALAELRSALKTVGIDLCLFNLAHIPVSLGRLRAAGHAMAPTSPPSNTMCNPHSLRTDPSAYLTYPVLRSPFEIGRGHAARMDNRVDPC